MVIMTEKIHVLFDLGCCWKSVWIKETHVLISDAWVVESLKWQTLFSIAVLISPREKK